MSNRVLPIIPGQSNAQIIEGSLRFDGDEYLSRTPASASNRTTWTYSTWIKRSLIRDSESFCTIFSANADGMELLFRDDGSLDFYDYSGGAYQYRLETNNLFVDASSWIHIVAVADTTNATSTERWRLYVNGVRMSSFAVETYGSQNYDSGVNNNTAHYIGYYSTGASTIRRAEMYATNMHLIDGQALDPSYFGFTDPLTNTWRPKKYTGTFGTNGFYLPMSKEDSFALDKSGNGNDWTPTGFSNSTSEIVKDSPSGAVYGGAPTSGVTTTSSPPANYATLNPLSQTSTSWTLSNGNLQVANTSGESRNAVSTMGMSSGKFYAEYLHTESSTGNGLIGIVPNGWIYGNYIGGTGGLADPNTSAGYGFYMFNRGILNEGSYDLNGNASNVHSRVPNGSTVGIALDMDNGKCWFSVDGVYQTWSSSGIDNPNPVTGVDAPVTGLTGEWYFAWSTAGNESGVWNFGQRAYKYAPPEGYLPLNSATVRPKKVITKPNQYFAVTTYTGNGTAQTINVDMKPDLIWIKERTESRSHGLYDTVRGSNKALLSNTSGGELTSTNRLSSINSDGFSVGSDTMTNKVSQDYVAWTWRAGGSSNTFNVDDVGYATAAAAGLDEGTIDPTGASVGTKQGFSIISYTLSSATGTSTYSHGLNQAPDMVWTKRTSAAQKWFCYFDVLGNNMHLNLDDTDAAASGLGFNSTSPTNSLITVDNSFRGTGDFVSYNWHNVPGLQKFGKYKGNQNGVQGPFVELGFRPALIILKSSGFSALAAYQSWVMYDSKRPGYNTTNGSILYANEGYAEGKRGNGDNDTYSENFVISSNGFRVQFDSGSYNVETNNDIEFIYCAWAESPFTNLYGGQSESR